LNFYNIILTAYGINKTNIKYDRKRITNDSSPNKPHVQTMCMLMKMAVSKKQMVSTRVFEELTYQNTIEKLIPDNLISLCTRL